MTLRPQINRKSAFVNSFVNRTSYLELVYLIPLLLHQRNQDGMERQN